MGVLGGGVTSRGTKGLVKPEPRSTNATSGLFQRQLSRKQLPNGVDSGTGCKGWSLGCVNTSESELQCHGIREKLVILGVTPPMSLPGLDIQVQHTHECSAPL